MTKPTTQAEERSIPTPFGHNVFIVNHARKHKFVSIAKGGCTHLKLVTATDDNVDVKDKRQIHTKYSSRPDGERIIPISSDQFDDYTRVVFWRDPVKRFYSWYSDKVQHVYQPYLISVGFALDDSYERALEFLKFELGKPQSEWIEEHVRPQSQIYSADDVDIVADMSQMNQYLEAIGVPVPENINKSKKPRTEMPDWVVAEMKKLYKADYDFYETLQSKMWDGASTPVQLKPSERRRRWLKRS